MSVAADRGDQVTYKQRILESLYKELTEKQLQRILHITDENYDWYSYTGPERCLAGHAFDLTPGANLAEQVSQVSPQTIQDLSHFSVGFAPEDLVLLAQAELADREHTTDNNDWEGEPIS